MDIKISAVQLDLKSAESKLTELKAAAANRWREFEVAVTEANARLKKSLDKALG